VDKINFLIIQPELQSLDPTKGEQLHDWRELTQIVLSLKDIQAATKMSLCMSLKATTLGIKPYNTN